MNHLLINFMVVLGRKSMEAWLTVPETTVNDSYFMLRKENYNFKYFS